MGEITDTGALDTDPRFPLACAKLAQKIQPLLDEAVDRYDDGLGLHVVGVVLGRLLGRHIALVEKSGWRNVVQSALEVMDMGREEASGE